MAYIVRIEVGRGFNRTIRQSIPLPSRNRVAIYINKNSSIRANTDVKVTNTITKKSIIKKPYYFTNLIGEFQRGGI